ncbi:MAG: stage III sporulation protein AB [Clostridia bacterium]|nr:stage III sporulation protein AB [Clostridia bacterium]
MKLIAAFLIAICFSSAGQFVSKQLELRIAKLEKIYVLFSDIKSRIEFTADCAGDIFSSLNQMHSYELLPFVGDCEGRLCNGESFDSAWKNSLLIRQNVTGLKKEDISVLVSFGSSFGTTDTAGQLSNCEIHKKLVEAKLNSARADFNLYSKPARGIGLLAGFATIILTL